MRKVIPGALALFAVRGALFGARSSLAASRATTEPTHFSFVQVRFVSLNSYQCQAPTDEPLPLGQCPKMRLNITPTYLGALPCAF